LPKLREIDAHDRKLLTLLQDDALLTADELARAVALSPSAITRRVRRLREDGTITANVAIVSDRVASLLSALVDVQFERHALDGVATFEARLSASPLVQAIFEVTGSFDLTVIVTVTDMNAFNAFADRMLAADPVVRRYETRFIKRRRKFSTALPIDCG
jgi:DNA-binding Lrp family transcriptional regulator